MTKLRVNLLLKFWFLGGLWGFSLCASAFTLPEKPTRYVNDYAAVLTPTALQGLENRFSEFERKTKHQAIVAVFPTIDGGSVEDVANKLFEKWGVGSKERNDGILLVLAMAEHDVRIEVGYGLEGSLPDALAGQIIRSDMFPFLRQGQTATAILAFEKRLEELFVEGKKISITPSRKQGLPLYVLIFIGIILVTIISKMANGTSYTHTLGSGGIYRRRRSSPFWWGGGGFGGGSGGFGGFGGGGGGLSGGGGASGRW
jgi:uncharacterized protein